MKNNTVSYRKFVIPEMIFGAGSLNLIDSYAKRFALENTMLVTDKGVMSAGWSGIVKKQLEAAGIKAVLFDEVTPNPKDHEVMKGAELYRKCSCDGIIAVGGGSPLDCAKGIAIVVTNGGHINAYEGVDKIPYPMPPLLCIPTTAGTAADISQFAIITNTAEKRKIAIVSKTVVPDIALIDPTPTVTMSQQMTACSGLDALVHAVEAFVSTASSHFTDMQALDAIRLIATNFEAVMKDPENMEARNGMALASTEAGMAFSNASLGAVHAMAHALGGILDSPHGECNALLLEYVIRFNFKTVPAKYRQVAEALAIPEATTASDEDLLEKLVLRIRGLRNSGGITGSLKDIGVESTMIPQLAFNAMHDACMITNPKRPVQHDIEAIYAAAI